MEGNGVKVVGAVVISAAVLLGAYFAFVGTSEDDTNDQVQVTTQSDDAAINTANPAGTSQLAPENEQTQQQNAAPAHVDGTYSANATYTVPSGDTESISVTLTLADDVISDLQVEMVATHPTSERYQGQFDEAVNGDVEGQQIDEFDASRIGGASLTSSAFNDILEAIREQSAQS